MEFIFTVHQRCRLRDSLPLSQQCTGGIFVLWMSPQSEICSWWTEEFAAAHPVSSPPSSPPPPEQKTPENKNQRSKLTDAAQLKKLAYNTSVCVKYAQRTGICTIELVLIIEKMLPRIPEQMSSSLCWRRCRWMWCKTTGNNILRDSGKRGKKRRRFAWAETVRPCCSVIFREKHFLKTFTIVSPGKKKRRLSTVRAIDCSLTTSIDWPMSTVLGMLPRVPLTYSATSWTVNICSSSSKISGKLFNSAALRGKQNTELQLVEYIGNKNSVSKMLQINWKS